MKKRFLLYTDALDVINDMSPEERGELLMAIYRYQMDQPMDLSPIVKIAFRPIKNQFIRDDETYKKVCEKNSQNANLRWNKDNASASDRIPSHTNGYESMPKVPVDADMTRYDMIIQDNNDKTSKGKDNTGSLEEEKNVFSGLDEYELK